MRYILYRFKGKPTEQPPVGMNDIIGMSEYKSLENAVRYLWTNRFRPMGPGGINEVDYLQVMAQLGYSHFGLYEVPSDFGQPDKLVKTITNPFYSKEKAT